MVHWFLRRHGYGYGRLEIPREGAAPLFRPEQGGSRRW